MRVGLLWRAEWDPPGPAGVDVERCRLHGVFAAFAALGAPAEPVVYSDDTVDAVRELLLELDGVLVWVNPIEQGRDRSLLDPLLREAASAGVWVSAHPDVILKIATKQVLVDTRAMSWSTDTRLYRTPGELREQLPSRIDGGAVVLKQHRGMGGDGVWKVERDGDALRVQHAAAGSAPERTTLDEFVRRCEPYVAGDGFLVEQPFQERIADGMIRAYLTHDGVVGFTHQYPRAFLPPSDAPSSKVFEPASAPKYAELRERLETEWVPQLREIAGVRAEELPVIWDCDFLFGPGDAYVLCEINASSTFAFPENAMPTVAGAALERIRARPSG